MKQTITFKQFAEQLNNKAENFIEAIEYARDNMSIPEISDKHERIAELSLGLLRLYNAVLNTESITIHDEYDWDIYEALQDNLKIAMDSIDDLLNGSIESMLSGAENLAGALEGITDAMTPGFDDAKSIFKYRDTIDKYFK